jgi:hypothetical protein
MSGIRIRLILLARFDHTHGGNHDREQWLPVDCFRPAPYDTTRHGKALLKRCAEAMHERAHLLIVERPISLSTRDYRS